MQATNKTILFQVLISADLHNYQLLLQQMHWSLLPSFVNDIVLDGCFTNFEQPLYSSSVQNLC